MSGSNKAPFVPSASERIRMMHDDDHQYFWRNDSRINPPRPPQNEWMNELPYGDPFEYPDPRMESLDASHRHQSHTHNSRARDA
ncbi:hypothetical protein K2P96_02845 [Patescibacteria group bacterium]|nr:hypothetical protein [Patescibacteria group bacterium]